MRCLLIGSDGPDLRRLARIFRELGWQLLVVSSLAAGVQAGMDMDIATICAPNSVDRLESEITLARELLSSTIVLGMGDFSVDTRMRALSHGANDYMPVSTSSRLLSARVRALMRLRGNRESDELDIGEMHVDMQHRRICDAAGELSLSGKEFDLLALLVRNCGTTLVRSELIEHLWPDNAQVADNSLEAHISRLRRKLRTRPGGRIATVRGMGYRFEM